MSVFEAIVEAHVLPLLDAFDPPVRRRKLCNKTAFHLICYVLRFGVPWSELRWQLKGVTPSTVYKRFQHWVNAGVLDKVWRTVVERYAQMRLRADPCWFSVLNVDTTMVKNVAGVDGTGPNPTDRGRSATKMSFIGDKAMVPISRQVYPANKNDVTTLEAAVSGIACTIHRDARFRSTLAGDKGYVSKAIAKRVLENHRIRMLVPVRRNMKARVFTERERAILKQRHKVENMFCRFDKFKRIYCRVDGRLASYVGFTDIAMILVTLRHMPFAGISE